METDKLISIILPVYNGEKYINEAIISCLNQTYYNFELIIIDDFSNDDSLNIVKRFSEKDGRITVISNNKNLKLPATLNIGHRHVKGDYITWTSDDNILKPNFLESLMASIIESGADVIYSNYDVITENGDLKRVHTTGPTEHILYGNKIGASFLYKKEVFQELKGYDESLFLLEDYDFWLRASIKFKFHHLSDNLYKYRLHSDSLTSDIQLNEDKKVKHAQGIVNVFQNIAEEFSWKKNTCDLLINNMLGRKIDLHRYWHDKNDIERDLLKFNHENFSSSQVILGLQLVIRNQLILNNCNFKTLMKVLKSDRSLLFHPSYSKKTTLHYILNCLFN